MSVATYAGLGSTPPSADPVYLEGYSAIGDGGQGFFYWDSTGTETPNNGTISAGTVSGRWKRIYNGAINVQWFGAVGDGSNADNAFVDAINYAISLNNGMGGDVIIPAGSYLITNNINIYATASIPNPNINIIMQGGSQILNSALILFDVQTNSYGQAFFSLIGSPNGRCEIRCIGIPKPPPPPVPSQLHCIQLSCLSTSSFIVPRNWGKIENILFVGGNVNCGIAIRMENYPTGVIEKNSFIGFSYYNVYAESSWANKYINNYHGPLNSSGFAGTAIGDGSNSLFLGERYEVGTSVPGIQFFVINGALGGNGVRISSCSFEPCSTGIDIPASPTGILDSLLIQSCYFETCNPINIQGPANNDKHKTVEINSCTVAGGSFTTEINAVEYLTISNTNHKADLTINNTVHNFANIMNNITGALIDNAATIVTIP